MTFRLVNLIVSLLAFLMISTVLNWLFYYFYHFRLHFYLKKHRPDLINYVSDGEKDGIDIFRGAFQRSKDWYFGDVGEEDETIKHYKSNLKISAKIGYIQLALMLVLTIMYILIYHK